MKPRALVFDMDGLMVDTERLYFAAEREIAASYGRAVDDRTQWKMMGRKPLEAMKIFIQDTGINAPPEELRAMLDARMREKLKTEVKAMPGLDEIIGAFREKLVLAICTSSIGRYVETVLDALSLRGAFGFVQTSDNVHKGKPDPEIYAKCAAGLGLAPGECLVLEDSANGVLAAKSAGCYVIAVPNEYTRGQDFSGANVIIASLSSAIDVINGLL